MGASQTKDGSGIATPEQDVTPKKGGVFKQQLHIDPRSPTDDIVRTPIIVDSVPSELKALDPRSPTYGIERTPLTALIGKDGSEVEEMEVEVEASPQLRPSVNRAPLCRPEDVGDTDSDMTTPQKPTVLSDPSSLEEVIPDIDAEDVSPLLENVEMQTLAIAEPTPVQSKVVSQPKKLFSVPHTVPAPAKQVPVSRSLGLVARDSNSPRSIVQTKQRRQVVKSMGGVGNQVGIDKENLAH